MDFATIFDVANWAAMSGWLALLAGLFVTPARKALFIYAGLALPALLAVAYLYFLVSSMTGAASGPAMDFTSLAGVTALLGSDAGATIGWLHFLAFDLFVGTWVARDGLARGAWPIVLVPVLGLTFMFGPIGLLSYLILWAVFLRRKAGSLPYAAPNAG